MSESLSEHLNPMEWFNIGAMAKDARTAGATIEKSMIELGADSIGIVFDMPKKLGDFPTEDEMFGNFITSEWHEFYNNNLHLVRHDIMARHLFTNQAPLFVDVHKAETLPVPAHSMSDEERAFIELAMDFGLDQTVGMSFFDRLTGRVSMLMANRPSNGRGDLSIISENHLSAFQLAVRFFLEGLEVRHLTSNEAPVRLSRREQDCLHWAAVGRSTKEIADIMKLSDNTVNEYFASAQRKLKASNRVQAVVRAYTIKLINP